MCSSGGGSTNPEVAARHAREREAARQAIIEQGREKIDEQFAGFNDDFYNQYQQKYTDFYNPQLQDQYSDARNRLTLQLARSGNLTSSVGSKQMGDLQKHFNTQQTGITNQALDAVNKLRSNIDINKSQLYADNRAAADPGNAAQAAQAAAQSLQPTSPMSPLANTFSDFFNNLGNMAAISNVNRGYNRTGVQNYNSNGSSSRVIK